MSPPSERIDPLRFFAATRVSRGAWTSGRRLTGEWPSLVAGGAGLTACQWLRAIGATVIGVVGSDEKAATAWARGCEHITISTRENIARRVREISGGAGVPMVYDSVGRDTFLSSLDCLRPLGLMVSFGNAPERLCHSASAS
jgi:NADPH:quinone reductase-like Zn-dependent oxidoreductase